jgi:hypothetical protein
MVLARSARPDEIPAVRRILEEEMKNRFAAVLGIAFSALLAFTSIASAQKPVSAAEAVSATFTITAIDHAGRIVTLQDKDGGMQDVYCGPDVRRFDSLKVGDKVTFRYYESMVTAISQPGTAPKPPVSQGVTRSAGEKPGGTVSQQMTATVTIAAIDQKVPSVTVTGPRGNKMSFKVDKKNLEGYKVGDKVDITYTQALAVSVDAAK